MAIKMYWFVLRCPVCGRLARGNAVQRALRQRDRGFFDDLALMPVKSDGYQKIRNEKLELWPNLRGLIRELREPAAELLDDLARRLGNVAYEAREAARRLRYG